MPLNSLIILLYQCPPTSGYVTCILDDAKFYANHARKKTIDLDDVKLASQMLLDKAFTNPPPRDVLLDLTRIRNSSPLPSIKSNSGLRLPPDRYCLSACNFRLKNKKAPGATGVSTIKKLGAGLPSIPKTAIKRTPIIGTASKVQTVTVPKPVFKFSVSKPAFNTGGTSQMVAKTPYDGDIDSSGVKRKREEDDFQTVD